MLKYLRYHTVDYVKLCQLYRFRQECVQFKIGNRPQLTAHVLHCHALPVWPSPTKNITGCLRIFSESWYRRKPPDPGAMDKYQPKQHRCKDAFVGPKLRLKLQANQTRDGKHTTGPYGLVMFKAHSSRFWARILFQLWSAQPTGKLQQSWWWN